MRFFLVARDRSTGDVRLMSDGTYATRDEALGVLRASGSSRDLDVDDLFVVDLDAVTPVVMYQAPASAPAPLVAEVLEESIADVWEAPDEAEPAASQEETAAAAAEPVAADSSPEIEDRDAVSAQPVEVEETADDLADALRRAASQMEGAGIVAPPSVEDYAIANADAALEEPAPVLPAPAEEADAWPWEAERTVTETQETTASRVPALEVVRTPDAETPELGPPVYVPVGIEEPGLEEISLLTPAEPSAPDEPADVDTTSVEETPAKAYEPGDLGVSAYTCDDCVYVATCPKNHQEGPATCGAFQWKPV